VTTRIIFIGGSGRSGTTLVSRVISQLPGFVALGEVREIWRDRVGQNRLCGCGQPFAECSFWQEVGDRAYGGWDNVDRSATEALVSRLNWLGAYRALGPGSADRQASPELAATLRRLYDAISSVTDGATLVDTSKGPPYGVALSSVPGLDFRAIHIVRDSRGIANSWLKEIPRPYTPGRVLRGHKLSAVSSVRWLVHNSEMELLSRRVPTTRLVYERFAEEPGRQTRRALAQLGYPIAPDAFAFLDEGVAQLRPDHTVAGNPNRLETGSIRVKPDVAWQRDLSRLQRLQVSTMTWPMLLRYGFRL
jgi:hypothetical protein